MFTDQRHVIHHKNNIHRLPSPLFLFTAPPNKSILSHSHSTTVSHLSFRRVARCLRRKTSNESKSLPVPRLRGLRLPSHASGNGSEDENDDTLRVRRRTESADTLPLSTIPTLELPEDPKTWSPTHLSAYLSSTLHGAGAGELPDQGTRVITAFVKEKQITGKTYLRLNEGALEGYVFLFSLVLPFLLFLFISTLRATYF